jgi:hypothetical protein
MTPKQFAEYLDRDAGRCYHCGNAGDNLVPQHRAGRGMGGSRKRNNYANIIVLCSASNGLLESDANFAGIGRKYGWKISQYDNPLEVPIYEAWSGLWYKLKDDGTRYVLP